MHCNCPHAYYITTRFGVLGHKPYKAVAVAPYLYCMVPFQRHVISHGNEICSEGRWARKRQVIIHNLSLTLTKRNNYFKVNGCLSSLLPVVSGVLQGSILGPLLLVFRCCMYPQPCRLKLLMILNACTCTRILYSYTSSQLASDQILLQNDINVLAIFDYNNPWH